MCLRVEIKGPRTRVPHKAPWAPRTLQAWTLEGSIRPACPSHFQSFHSESQVPGSTLMGSKGHRHRGPARWGTPLPPRPHLSEDRPDQRGQALGPRLPLDWLCRLQRHRRQVSQEEHGVQGCPIPPPACSWPPGGPPHRQMPPSARSALPSPALPVPARPSGQTFCGPCKAVPLCSLPCGLGRMVGGKVQMGPCSPSSASASLEGKAGSPRPWGPAPRPPPRPRCPPRAAPRPSSGDAQAPTCPSPQSWTPRRGPPTSSACSGR